MTTPALSTTPTVSASLAVWHDMVSRGDLSNLASIVHPDAVFRSPVAFSPYHSAGALILALGTVSQVFQDFAYHRQFASPDGLNVVLEFSARVNDKQLKGVDLIRFNEDGKIVEFEVMVRTMSGLQALGAEMGARLSASLPGFKAKI